MVERTHKARERNSKVVELAKNNFKNKHGKLFCQVCDFDFEDNYGIVGKDFIEGHHTIAVSVMPADYKTKPEEIAMLCGNCHRMVHKKRPWLTMEELTKVLKTKT
ncbi:MAG: HNH endonuclease [Bacteroidota bacterium]